MLKITKKISFGAIVLVLLFGCQAWRAEGTMPSSAPGNGLFVFFAPHPDDETFCCAVAILRALAEGRRVHVVIFTNGDGWPLATAAHTNKREEELTPRDYLEMARVRQGEALAALGVLGLTSEDITFLGYPDAGLDRVYSSVGTVPFQLEFTRKVSTYGPIVADFRSRRHRQPGAYLRESVLEDVVALIRELKPRRLYVTHGVDTHLDHRAAFWFVRDAVRAVGYRGEIYTYVLHRDSYPCPTMLPCPAPAQPAPSVGQADVKFKALMRHQSQVWHFFGSEDALKVHAAAPEQFWPLDPVSFDPL